MVIMKGKTIEEATKAAREVLGISEGEAKVRVINEGKPGLMGVLGGEEAEVEVTKKLGSDEEAKDILQNILDKMEMLAIAELSGRDGETILINIKGEDMGRIIGKEGAMLKALEVVVGGVLWKQTGERIRVRIDAGGYQDKRVKVLERLAAEVAREVEETGREKPMPFMSASDRRAIHMHLKDNPKVTTYSVGEGKDRKLVIAPKS